MKAREFLGVVFPLASPQTTTASTKLTLSSGLQWALPQVAQGAALAFPVGSRTEQAVSWRWCLQS